MPITIADDAPDGISLHLEDGRVLHFTRTLIAETSRKWLSDPALLPSEMQSATAFRPCSVCPAADTARICHALGPSMAFFDRIDEFDSFTPVTVVLRETDPQTTLVKKTTMQRALQYITLLSVMEYCESGAEYQSYFVGLNPLMEPEEFADGLFKTIFCEMKGDLDRVRLILTRLINQIRITSHCQIKRTRLVYQRDALVNAYIATAAIADFLSFRFADFAESIHPCIA
jgi:hypothetical protein